MHAVVRQLQPPPSNSITPESLNYNKGSLYLATVATLVSIALSIFLLRVYTRIRILRYLGIDDCLISVSALCSVGILVLFTLLIDLGVGKHFGAVPNSHLLAIAQLQWYFTLLTIIGISFAKFSVVIFLLRIVHRTAYRRVLYGMIAVLMPLTAILLCTHIFQCVPVSAAWDSAVPIAQCMSHATYRKIGLLNSSINAITDLMVSILPIPVVCTLRISLRARISLIAVLGLGFLASAAAIARIPMTYNLPSSPDPFAHGAWAMTLSVVEMTLGITASCLATLRPLLASLLTLLSHLNPGRSRRSSTHSSHHPTQDPSRVPTEAPFLTLPPFTQPKPFYLRRFHDHGSCLDFDLETPSPRSLAHSNMHSRNASGVTNITNYSFRFEPMADSPSPKTRSRKGSRGRTDMEEDAKPWRVGYAVSITSRETPWEEGDPRTTRRGASDEESALGKGTEDGCAGGIMRTTTTEVTIT